MLKRRQVLALALAQLTVPAALVALSGESRAQGPKPKVEIVVLYAKKDPAAKGPQLGPGVPKIPQLSQPPFTGYNTFTVVGQTTLTLDSPKAADPWKGKPSGTYTLATGKPLALALLDQLPDKRFQIGAAIGASSPDVVRWDAPKNDPVFIAGQSYKDGILIIGITLRAP
jgi:hypothetical protein